MSKNASFFRSDDEGPGRLRLHLNETPYGPPPGAVEAVREEADCHLAHYPDPATRTLRAALARHFAVDPRMLTVGNGVDELILLTALTFAAGPDAEVTCTQGTFPGYGEAARAVGATVRALPLTERHAVPGAAMAAALADGTDLAFVCNPLNPTGAVLDATEVADLLAAAQGAPGRLLFDEAYLDFAGPDHDHALERVRSGAPALVTRTFSKAWGLASIRLGVLIGPPQDIARVERTARALPFRVSRPAQRAVRAALSHPAHLERVRTETARARDHLIKSLDTIGVTALPSAANFVMAELPDGADSSRVAARLAAEHRVLVRDLTLLGLPGRLRITVGTVPQVEQAVSALAAVLHTMEPSS
ncbi:pyridoxal phosphate-dependent aminotransferase [Streptomyces xiamenensis]